MVRFSYLATLETCSDIHVGTRMTSSAAILRPAECRSGYDAGSWRPQVAQHQSPAAPTSTKKFKGNDTEHCSNVAVLYKEQSCKRRLMRVQKAIKRMRRNSPNMRVNVVTQILVCRKQQKLSIWRLT